MSGTEAPVPGIVPSGPESVLQFASPCYLANRSLVRLVFWVLLLQVELEMSSEAQGGFSHRITEYREFQETPND